MNRLLYLPKDEVHRSTLFTTKKSDFVRCVCFDMNISVTWIWIELGESDSGNYFPLWCVYPSAFRGKHVPKIVHP